MISKIILAILLLLSLSAYAEWTAYIQETEETISLYDGTEESKKANTVTYRKISDNSVHTATIVSFDAKTNIMVVRTKDGKTLTISIADC